ncbi:hypothetical protein [Ruminococcus sp.]|jgi:hypothetical protein|uniref:hypothetical protein n=1 Tax=Ruminococcus sp. TaxID=41978 RepID=UPI0025E35F57|nr:hypothetical protein [Ruminococcus sp.]
MNKLKLFKVIDLIDDDLIKEAEIKSKDKSSSENEREENIIVSGVEVYKKKWQRTALVAAAFLLVVGLSAGGVLMFRNRPPMLDDPALPSDISATDSTSPFERVTDGESSTTNTKKNEKATKESSDITVTAAVKDENKPAVTTALDPMYAEINLISQPQSDNPTQTQETGTEDFINHAKEFPVVTTPDGTELPIATKSDNVEDFINHAQDFPVVTSPDGSQKPIATKPIVDDPDGFANFDIFESLASLRYSPDTCDGLPEYVLLAPDGTWYYINLSSGWIWRKTPDHQWTQPPEEAWLTKTQLSYLRQHGEEIGMRLDIFD